jgi:hypothetical protein
VFTSVKYASRKILLLEVHKIRKAYILHLKRKHVADVYLKTKKNDKKYVNTFLLWIIANDWTFLACPRSRGAEAVHPADRAKTTGAG